MNENMIITNNDFCPFFVQNEIRAAKTGES